MNKMIRQEKLDLKVPEKVCVVGAGGVGAWVSILLAQVGVKELSFFDDDIVENHNRNRLPYGKSFIGYPKIYALKRFIEERFEDCAVFDFNIRFSPDFLILRPEYIIDCTDDFKAQKEIYRWALKNHVKYLRAGSKENHITVLDFVPLWVDEEEKEKEEGKCGVTISQWIVPQIMVAAGIVRWICLGKKIVMEEV